MRPAKGQPQFHANVVTETKVMRANHAPTTATDPVSRGLIGFLIVAAIVMTGSGCRLCCDSEDIAYPAYGGLWERTNRNSGRVGSLFDPGGARGGEMATELVLWLREDFGANDYIGGALIVGACLAAALKKDDFRGFGGFFGGGSDGAKRTEGSFE